MRCRRRHRLLIPILAPVLVACTDPPPRGSGLPPPRPLGIDTLLKSDVDTIIELAMREELLLMRRLLWRLYRFNPDELAKTPGATMFSRERQLFDDGQVPTAETGGRRGAAAIAAGLDDAYRGDRVFALVFGLKSMMLDSFGGDRHLYLTDSLDPQRIYNAARNLEVALIRLGADRSPTLRIEGKRPCDPHESVEHLFGRLIALQDLSALAAAESQQRVLKLILQTAASAVFLPV